MPPTTIFETLHILERLGLRKPFGYDRTQTEVWVIELRNGSLFQSLEANDGGSAKTAKRFSSKAEAEQLMDRNPWIYQMGGLAKKL